MQGKTEKGMVIISRKVTIQRISNSQICLKIIRPNQTNYHNNRKLSMSFFLVQFGAITGYFGRIMVDPNYLLRPNEMSLICHRRVR